MSQFNPIDQVFLVSGNPHILLTPEKSASWNSLNDSYKEIREKVSESDADMILYFSTSWISVLGYMFQADPNPKWKHVDPNWHDLGTMHYDMKVDTKFAEAYEEKIKPLGFTTKLINYEGFPIDTGTIVASKLINPDNKKLNSMVSLNLYSDRSECNLVGLKAIESLKEQKKKAIVVLVSNLSNRYFSDEIDPMQDAISSENDDKWNKDLLEKMSSGDLRHVFDSCEEYCKNANGDLIDRAMWWLEGVLGRNTKVKTDILNYKPVWGSGSAMVMMSPILTDNHSESKFMKQEENVHTDGAPEPVGPYPHAKKVGDLLFVSGMGPRKRGSKTIPGVELNDEGNIVSYDVEIQTHSVLNNIKQVLKGAGCEMKDIVDIQVFLTNMKDDFKSFNKVYGEYFDVNGPTRTTVEVLSLPTPIAVELKVIAKLAN